MYFYDTLRKTVISEKKIINTLQIVNYGHKTFFLLKDTFMIFFKMQNSGKINIYIFLLGYLLLIIILPMDFDSLFRQIYKINEESIPP